VKKIQKEKSKNQKKKKRKKKKKQKQKKKGSLEKNQLMEGKEGEYTAGWGRTAAHKTDKKTTGVAKEERKSRPHWVSTPKMGEPSALFFGYLFEGKKKCDKYQGGRGWAEP